MAASEQKKWRTSHTSVSLLDQEPDHQTADIVHDTPPFVCIRLSGVLQPDFPLPF